MDWDTKTSSWDWDNLMPDSGRETTFNVEQKNSYTDAQIPASVSVNHSDRVEEDLCRNKMEQDEDRSNVGFLGLRNQAGMRDSQEGTRDNSNNRDNGNFGKTDHHAAKRSFFIPEQHQRSYTGSGSKAESNVEDGESKRNGALTVVDVLRGSGDSHIGLKLGKRTYFEDTTCAGAVKAATTHSSVFPSSSVPPKKSRAPTQGTQIPRCQVEGCKTELTSAKEYHRRHKVCETHSKSPKVTVAGLEQRFCQQCSRFHELKEFDEGKRSCRRRLAGHNERRRKPQPDAIALNSARLTSTFHDNRNGSFLTDRSFLMHPRIVSSSVLEDPSDFKLGHGKRTWPRIIKTEDQPTYNGHLPIPGIDQQSYASSVSRNSAEKMLLFLQSSKNMPSNVLNHSIPHFMQSSGSPVGQALTLSSSSGTGVISGLAVTSATQRLSGVSDSGRALSLLSSQSWGSRASGSASMDVTTRSGVTLEQLIHENQPPMGQPLMQGLQHNFDLVEDNKLLTISSQAPVSLVSSGFLVSGRSSIDKERHGGTLATNIGSIGNFEGHMLGLLQGHGFRGSQGSQDVRCTIDLMRRSSNTQANESQGQSGMVQQGSDQFAEFQPLRSYESSIFDSQQMM